ncbi:MAG: hypothetical protein RL226_1996, partial [Bacteroidota bacterium]
MRRALRILFRTVLGVLAFVLLIWVLIQLPPVQTWLINRIADRLEEKTGFQFDIASVDIRFPVETVIRGVTAIDSENDTLVSVSELILSGMNLTADFDALDLRKVELTEPYFNLVYQQGDSLSNLDQLLSHFPSSDTTSGGDFPIAVNAFSIRNGRFVYHDYNFEPIDTLIDFNHLVISNLFIEADQTTIDGSNVKANIENLALKEAGGFELRQLSALFELRPDTMLFTGARIQTPGTDLDADLMFIAPWSSYQEFTSQVVMRHNFRPSLLDFKDLWYFSTDLYGLDKTVEFRGRVRGPVANMKARDLRINVDENTWFAGKVDIAGLPYIDETFIDLTLDDLHAVKKELDKIPLYPFDSGELLQTPENFSVLGDIGFKGKFTGFLTDFVAFGTLTTRIGSVSTDIKLQEIDEMYRYSGSLKTNDFHLGLFYGAPELGTITSKFNVLGEGLTRADLDLEMDGIIQDISIEGYRYKDITAEGTFRKNFFNGDIAINDENAQLTFSGKVDFNRKVPEVDFFTSITNINLGALNLADLERHLSISGDFSIKGVGSNINNINADVVGDDVLFCTIDREFPIEHLELHMSQEKQYKKFVLDSDIASGRLEGVFDFGGLQAALNNIVADVIPTWERNTKYKAKEDFELDIDIHTFELVSEIFLPELYLADASTLRMNMNDAEGVLETSFSSEKVAWENYILDTVVVDISRPDEALYFTLLSNRLSIDGLTLNNFGLDVRNESQTLFTNLSWGNSTDLLRGEIMAESEVISSSEINTYLTNAQLVFDDAPWVLQDTAAVLVNNKHIHIDDFFLSYGSQSIRLQGDISEDADLPLNAELRNVDLKLLDPLLESSGLRMRGIVTGDLTARDLYDKTTLTSDLVVAEMLLNDYLIGDVCVESTWDNKQRRLLLGGEIDRLTAQTLKFGGYYTPEDEESPIDITCELNKLPLEFINAFLEEGISDISGSTSGRIKITGTLDAPALQGRANFENASLHVDYLNTTYYLKESFGIYPDMFTIDRVQTLDEEGNKAYLVGTIIHDNFGDWNFDVYLDMEEQPFLVMNTTVEDNSMYYGKAYATGYASVFGTEYDLSLDLNVRTEKGTVLALPLGESEDVYFADFITFIDHTAPVVVEEPFDLSGIDMNLELDITPDAQFRIIFDEAVGDEMRGRGRGHLNMVINNLSTFNMYGNVTVEQGRYLFTLKNLINKEFELEPGGTISWYGDPFEANINLRTAYRLNTTVYDLMPEGTGDQY